MVTNTRHTSGNDCKQIIRLISMTIEQNRIPSEL